MKHSLQARLIVAFIAIAIIPLLLVGIILGWQSYVVQQQQALIHQRDVARRVLGEVKAFIHGVETELNLFVKVRGFDELAFSDQVNLFTELLLFDTVFDELTLLDENGQERVRVSRLELVTLDDLRNRAADPMFSQPQETGKIYYSPVYFNQKTREPQMTIALPLFDSNTRAFSGVLVAEIRFKKVWDLIGNLDVAENGNVYMMDETGKVIAHRNPSVVLADTTFQWVADEVIQPGLDGSWVVLGATEFEFGEQTFIIVTEKPVAQALALARYTVFITIGLLVVTLIVVSFLGVYVVKRIIQPVKELADTARAFSEGDLSQQVTVTGEDEIGQLGYAFNQMARQLHSLINDLEKRIQKRTKLLKTSTEVSRQITTILDLEKLLHFVVNRLQESFNYYHVHIYLFDEETQELVMVEGSGEVGQQLKARNHRLQLGQGIVGMVARDGDYFLSNNVNESPNFFRNPLLPNTQSELAVSLRKGGRILGVLDIQGAEVNRFTDVDIDLMQSIADQTVIAIDNARLLSERQATIIQLQEVDRAKSQFITMMSHELRTPLNAINGFAELILLGLSGDLPPQAKDDVQLIYDNGQHLTVLINDVIDISQIEAGQVQIKPHTVAVRSLVNEVVEASSSLIKTKPLHIKLEFPSELPSLVADPVRIKQVLLNLVGNAVKFTSEGQIIIRVTVDEADCRFTVIDTGIGIPPNKHALIFEKFQQADMSDARQYGGTGLGLSICLELVHLHGGRMGVKSEEGKGSEFWFTIPLPQPEVTAYIE